MSYLSFTLLTTISFVSFIIGWLLKIKIDAATCLEHLMSEPDAPSSQHSLYIHHTVNRIGKKGLVESEPKTATSKRKVILPQFVIEALHQQYILQEEIRAKAGAEWRELDLVFSNSLGGYIEPSNLRVMFKRVLKSAGLADMRFHDLRHSAATLLLSMGAHPKLVQELLGHSTISITMDTYSHVLPSMHREMMDGLDDFFKRT
jgi:integrase